jgi:hypothetical protein
MIGDLSTVWLIAFVRETETPNVVVGQALNFGACLPRPGLQDQRVLRCDGD